MFFYSLPSSSSSSGSGIERFVSAAFGLFVWAMLAMLGLVFATSLAIWLVVMVVVSLVSSMFTGRPAAVTVLWRRYREMTRQRWPHQRTGSATPRADATDVTGASASTRVQDVHWRDVPPAPKAPAPRQQS
ncbi:MAG: hypothetical protein Q4G70_06950 [Pseudomonadota bacterium]|nr:hypothetical protein [Pseudomonadota bacterium]